MLTKLACLLKRGAMLTARSILLWLEWLFWILACLAALCALAIGGLSNAFRESR